MRSATLRVMTSTALPPDLAEPRCERCGQVWLCGMNGPAPCACTTLQLNAGQLADLRQRYRACLCLACLQAIAGGASPEPTATAPH